MRCNWRCSSVYCLENRILLPPSIYTGAGWKGVRMRSRVFMVAAALLVCFDVLPVCGQSSATADVQSKPPILRTNTRAVVVDVVVTKGEDPVLSLRRQDFEVFEDGKQQTIDFFEEHTAKTLPASAIVSLPKMPPHVYTNVPPAPESDSVNVLLLDALNTDKEDQIYVHNQIINFLKTMQPGTRVAIFTLSSKLRMVQGFTTDTAVLRDALNNPKYGATPQTTNISRSVQDKVEDVEELKRMEMMAGGHTTAGVEAVALFQQEFASFRTDQRVGMTLEAMQALARYLASVPGRKNLIWFSSSFPVTIFPRYGERQTASQTTANSQRDYTTAVRQTADLLTVSKVAVYPVGAEGVMSEHVFEANVDSPTDYEGGSTEGGSRAGGGVTTPYVNENSARADKIAAMEGLAADTGGKAYFNTNDLDAAMHRAIADGAHYYTISYTPTNKKMDGSYRRIEVKLASGKYRLSYRRGYNADDNAVSDGKPEANPLHGLMMHGMPNATQILFGARVLPADPQPPPNATHAGKNPKLAGPTMRYNIDLMIRWTDVKLTQGSDGSHTGRVQVELIAYDRDGKALNWAGETQAMNLKPDIFAAIEQSGLPAHLEIDLPAETEIRLSAGVFDWETGKAGTMEVLLPRAIGQAKNGGPAQ